MIYFEYSDDCMRSDLIECVKLSLSTVIDLFMSFSMQEHTDWVMGVQCDDFQIISGSKDGTLLVHDFLGPIAPILTT